MSELRAFSSIQRERHLQAEADRLEENRTVKDQAVADAAEARIDAILAREPENSDDGFDTYDAGEDWEPFKLRRLARELQRSHERVLVGAAGR